MKRIHLVGMAGVVMFAAVAFGSACGGGSESDGGDVDAGPIEISLTDNVFEPKDLRIPVNTEVEITIVNNGTAVHNMKVLSADAEGEDFKSDALVNPGQSSTFTVEFTTKGTFDFQCDYHVPDMVGTITVS